MNALIKNIYKLMANFCDCQGARWQPPQLLQRIQAQININHHYAHQGEPLVWKDMAYWKMEHYLENCKRSYEVRNSIVVTDEAIEVGELLSPMFEDRFEGKLIPFRDRKHTKGSFRRSEVDDE